VALDLINFAPFQLDLRADQLRRDGTPVPLRPKTIATLRYLAARPGELVTKQALLDAVWTGVSVTEDVVRVSVGELRAAFGDERAAPRFIETVSRRGYRFIAKLDSAAAVARGFDPIPADDWIVGRERERAEIGTWLRAALSGRRQIGFITGEAGIGKTTLVDAAIRDLEQTSEIEFRVARGQCVEQYGGGSPYLPVLEAIASLRTGADGPAVDAVLRRHAPGWLLGATPEAIPADPAKAVQSTHEHDLHRLAAGLAAIAERTPLVLVFEDVHWSDYSTLDLLSVLAQRREPTRLLVLCTLRPAEAIAHAHPVTSVKRELVRRGSCSEIPLGGLPGSDVVRYLAARFPGSKLPGDLLPLLIARSDGIPFFVVALIDHLLERGMLFEGQSGWELHGGDSLSTAIPEGLRAIIEPRLERLTADELYVLDVASVAGSEFATQAVASLAREGSELRDVEFVEQLCDGFARRQGLLRESGEMRWPDGTTGARYAFRHSLYQQVIYQRLAPSRRRRLHQAIGERLETAYAGRTEEIASALAAHFERSGDVERGVRYHGEAAARARSRFAYQETRLHVEAALLLMNAQPETADQLKRRIPMLGDLGWASFAHKGWGDEGAANAFAQMRELADRTDGTQARFKAMEGELIVHTMRGEYAIARRKGDEMMRLAQQFADREAILNSIPLLGATSMHLGDAEAARELTLRGLELGDPLTPSIQSIGCFTLLAAAYAHLGSVARARATNQQAIALAEKSGDSFLRAHTGNYAAIVYAQLRDVAIARALADQTVQLANDHGFSVLLTTATLYRGWCDVQQGRIAEGVEALQTSLDAYLGSGQRISTTAYSGIVAEGYLAAGDARRANEVLDAALRFVAETGECHYEHEIYRLKGECLLAGGADRARRAQAIAHFERALSLAVHQKALLFELRAATSLFRAEPASARDRLARLVARFASEDDCTDVRAAVKLLGD
jgi:DNA-binding winged helix-turn-helix (wHTH) protein/tetratricopeptide (TPR) repeat protein